ncbi:hypothetical protein HaLaN_00276 [Haematococcus lacustris]|uniref:Uncharacterized protein n=1 Tax=Haematococcus lacustris TaxID=44745 RepID=A0A699YRP0_HAELA|nr:hypothetical protein HaLaN_00276 [Haematococcus lacustris]
MAVIITTSHFAHQYWLPESMQMICLFSSTLSELPTQHVPHTVWPAPSHGHHNWPATATGHGSRVESHPPAP